MDEVLRKNQRAFVALKGQLQSNNSTNPALIENISCTGALLQCFAELEKNQSAEISITLSPGVVCGPLKAECVWSDKTHIGLRFSKLGSLESSTLEKLIHYHRL